ncbi:GntT/GntP/DsdX family permease, partial [Bacillus pumilus]
MEKGVGSRLGDVGLVVGFGGMVGKLMGDCGGGEGIGMRVIEGLGIGKIEWARMVSGFVMGIGVFYERGLIMLIRVVFRTAEAGRVAV